MFEDVDWSKRGEYMRLRHGVSTILAAEALADPARVVIEPDYASQSGRTVRVIGFSLAAGAVLTIIVLPEPDVTYGVNGWPSNSTDRRIYREGIA